MTPTKIAWMTAIADQWEARARDLRLEPGRSAAVRAASVQDLVDDFRRQLAGDPRPTPPPPRGAAAVAPSQFDLFPLGSPL